MDLANYPAPLPLAELADEVSRMAYRPGWSLTVFSDPHEGAKLRIVAKVEDGYHPGRSIDLGISSRIPDIIETRDQFRRWALWRLLEVEAHECREYFRVDGQLFRDPHDPIEPA